MRAFFVELHNLHDVFYVAKSMPMFYQVLGELRLLGVVLKCPQVFLVPRVEIATCCDCPIPSIHIFCQHSGDEQVKE